MRCRILLLKITLVLSLSVGCTSEQLISEADRERQYRIDSVIAQTLFEDDLDQLASYKIRNDGTVVIKFSPTVPRPHYTRVVDSLRAHPAIDKLYAEQGGQQVCRLR